MIFNILISNLILQTDITKIHKRNTSIIIREAMKDLREDNIVDVNKAQFELSLSDQLGITLRMVQDYMRELQTRGFILIDKANNEIILKKLLDT